MDLVAIVSVVLIAWMLFELYFFVAYLRTIRAIHAHVEKNYPDVYSSLRKRGDNVVEYFLSSGNLQKNDSHLKVLAKQYHHSLHTFKVRSFITVVLIVFTLITFLALHDVVVVPELTVPKLID